MQLLIEKIVPNSILLNCTESVFFLEIDLMKGDSCYLERLITTIKTAIVSETVLFFFFFHAHSKQMWQMMLQ